MYVPYNPNPCGLSTGDCTVRAISKALDISWDSSNEKPVYVWFREEKR